MAHFLFSAFADEASPSIAEQIEACKKNGIEYIELRNCDGKNISNLTTAEAEALKKQLDEGGIKVSSIGSHYGKIEITDDFEPHFEAFKNTVEVAKILGAKYIRMFSFYFTKGESTEEYKDEVLRRVGAMAEYSYEKGVLCCHENEKGIFGDIPERCLLLAETFGEKLGCVFDPANYLQCGAETLSGFRSLEKYVTYMHIKDVQVDSGTVVPAGEGDGKLEEILRILDSHEKPYFLSVEPHLRVFDGLDGLEPDDETANKMNKYVYPDNKTSFAAACSAIHEIVEKHSAQGYEIIIVGDDKHPEVMGITGWSCKAPFVIKNTSEAEALKLDKNKKYCMVSQTTFNHNNFKNIVEIIEKKGYDILVLNTICNATHERQEEAERISKEVDVMIVIGNKDSSNTRKLYEICSKNCRETCYIQTVDDLDSCNFNNSTCVGITAGASTPNNIIEEVQNSVRNEF